MNKTVMPSNEVDDNEMTKTLISWNEDDDETMNQNNSNIIKQLTDSLDKIIGKSKSFED